MSRSIYFAGHRQRQYRIVIIISVIICARELLLNLEGDVFAWLMCAGVPVHESILCLSEWFFSFSSISVYK